MEHDKLQSEFNYALSYLEALRKLEDACNQCSINGDFKNWLKCVKAFRRELSRRMKQDEKDEIKKLINKAERVVNAGKGNDLLKEELIEEAEIYLRNVMQKRGMDLPSKQDQSHSLMWDSG